MNLKILQSLHAYEFQPMILWTAAKICRFFAKPLKLGLALPNHDDDTLKMIGINAVPNFSSVSKRVSI
jgi:hypothetical protein